MLLWHPGTQQIEPPTERISRRAGENRGSSSASISATSSLILHHHGIECTYYMHVLYHQRLHMRHFLVNTVHYYNMNKKDVDKLNSLTLQKIQQENKQRDSTKFSSRRYKQRVIQTISPASGSRAGQTSILFDFRRSQAIHWQSERQKMKAVPFAPELQFGRY